ncbi:Formyl-CoA:oxalate CoA-transferase [Vanrija pseudolonga]|uniref:Formyl-CoA:oxalate CoA-transferase n=1 Tax=Vanrija pseudolonga TaxID=143232 RepID=A0AAF0Y2X5_9TREE|nr:Formyl-CoA:oxalate CoA-transferase [Vanrija pseudolonga]
MTSPNSVVAGARGVMEGLLSDPRLHIPDEIAARAQRDVTFVGNPDPFLPVPFRIAEALAGLKGVEAAFAGAIAEQRGLSPGKAAIDVEQSALFMFSTFLARINGKVPNDPSLTHGGRPVKDTDIHHSFKNRYRQLATNCYRTKDGRYYYTHGSLDARATMRILGMDPDRTDLVETKDILQAYGEAVGKFTAAELDEKIQAAGLPGAICLSVDEFLASEQGKAIADAPVYELTSAPGPKVSWPAIAPNTKPQALTGIKVLDLTRVIAGPAIGRGLADHGATVLRVTSPNLPDLQGIVPDLHAGKYSAYIDLDAAEGRETLASLVRDADVLIDGYRPGALERRGFGRDAVRKLNPSLVYVRENCYGWRGPWAGRAGWQQIADAVSGVSARYADKLGHPGEAIQPIFPSADYGSGVAGLVGTMQALYERARSGGVFDLDVSLCYYNLWELSLGLYDDAVWERIRPSAPVRHNWDVVMMLGGVGPSLRAQRPSLFTRDDFWQVLPAPTYGPEGKVRILRPVVKFEHLPVLVSKGPSQNGDDAAAWPASST